MKGETLTILIALSITLILLIGAIMGLVFIVNLEHEKNESTCNKYGLSYAGTTDAVIICFDEQNNIIKKARGIQ